MAAPRLARYASRRALAPVTQLPEGQQHDLPGQRPMADFLVIGPLAGLLGSHWTVRFGRLPCGQLG